MTIDLLAGDDRVRPAVLGSMTDAASPGRCGAPPGAPLQRARHDRALRRRADPGREQVRPGARGHRRHARPAGLSRASSRSRCRRRSGSPRPTTTSCWATRPSTAPRIAALAGDEQRRGAGDADGRRPRASSIWSTRVVAPGGRAEHPRRHRRGRVVARARRSATSACTARRCTIPARSRTSRARSSRARASVWSD